MLKLIGIIIALVVINDLFSKDSVEEEIQQEFKIIK